MRPSATALLILALVVVAACDVPSEPSRPAPIEIGEGQLAEDAARLALVEMAKSDSLARMSPYIDSDLRESLYNALVAVEALEHPARDSVVALYGIRTFPWISTQELMVIADLGAASVEAWRQGEQRTGIDAIDSVIVAYDLEVVEHRALEGLGWDMFVLRTPHHLNLFAVARRLRHAPGLLFASPDGGAGDGSDIAAERIAGAWILSYRVGWGDCPAGCTEKHYWRFRVDDSGRADFIGSEGPPAPPPNEFHPGAGATPSR